MRWFSLTWLLRDMTDDGVDDLLVLLEIGETALADLWPLISGLLFDTALAGYDLVRSVSSYEDEVVWPNCRLIFPHPATGYRGRVETI
ncbi:MAG: hypothetical protein IPL78_19995 [Chloroflexi bacterium]|nr:hypothetical protein [Chloroflexota bacterium]